MMGRRVRESVQSERRHLVSRRDFPLTKAERLLFFTFLWLVTTRKGPSYKVLVTVEEYTTKASGEGCKKASFILLRKKTICARS